MPVCTNTAATLMPVDAISCVTFAYCRQAKESIYLLSSCVSSLSLPRPQGLPLPLLKICDFGYSKAHFMSAPKSKVRQDIFSLEIFWRGSPKASNLTSPLLFVLYCLFTIRIKNKGLQHERARISSVCKTKKRFRGNKLLRGFSGVASRRVLSREWTSENPGATRRDSQHQLHTSCFY